ncbi:type III secretion system export apparatus subunit SctS [Bradyrhizobium oligotrophicum]|uniref:type III secretion system export apparatus subunit SctS n=1 Tax=Bradyrhizobium oligotrophicum TaxID=44255 RepID=UPI003EBA66B9
MGQATIVDHLVRGLTVVLIFAMPPLGVAMVVGLFVSILQAATQIQDQVLPQTIKLIAVVATLAVFGAVLAAPLIQYADQILAEFPALTR